MPGECKTVFSSRRRHTRSDRDWSSDVCPSDLAADPDAADADAIRASARETLETAGRRAGSLALSAEARRYFERAAGLATDETERAGLLAEAGAAAARSADHEA